MIRQNNETVLEYAIRLLDEDNTDLSIVQIYQLLFGENNVSYDNAQRQLRGIRKFIELIKSDNQEIMLETQKSKQINLSINADGTQTRDALLVLSEEEVKTPELLLKAHGYDVNKFELVSSKNSMWHQKSNSTGLSTLYCSKITVRPRNEISLTEVEEIFNRLSRGYTKINNDIYPYKSYSKKSLVLNFFDVHFNKLAHEEECGNEYNYRIARERMIDSAKQYQLECSDYCFENIYFAIGQDYFNSEPTGETVGHTKQDNDCRYGKMFEEGVSALIDVIDILKEMGEKVYVPLIQGNHSTYTEFYAAQFLKAWYRNDDRVIVDASVTPRKYYQYGINLFGFTHNSEEKNRIYNLMQIEEPIKWGETIERTFFTGHLHCEDVKEVGGIYIRQAPTLCGTDAWHKRTGYVNPIKRTQGFIYDFEDGLKEIKYVSVK